MDDTLLLEDTTEEDELLLPLTELELLEELLEVWGGIEMELEVVDVVWVVPGPVDVVVVVVELCVARRAAAPPSTMITIMTTATMATLRETPCLGTRMVGATETGYKKP